MGLHRIWSAVTAGLLGEDFGFLGSTEDPDQLVKTAVQAVTTGIWTAGGQVVVPDGVTLTIPPTHAQLLARPRLLKALTKQINEQVNQWVKTYTQKQRRTHHRQLTVDMRELFVNFETGDFLAARAEWADSEPDQRGRHPGSLDLSSDPSMADQQATIVDLAATVLDQETRAGTTVLACYTGDELLARVPLTTRAVRAGRSNTCDLVIPSEFTRVSGIAAELRRNAIDRASVKLTNRNGAWHEGPRGISPLFVASPSELELAVHERLYLTSDKSVYLVVKDSA